MSVHWCSSCWKIREKYIERKQERERGRIGGLFCIQSSAYDPLLLFGASVCTNTTIEFAINSSTTDVAHIEEIKEKQRESKREREAR